MAKIMGKYIVRASLNDFTTNFVFANGDRNTRLTLNNNEMLSFTCPDISRPINNGVSFNSQAVLKVKAIRIVTTGAEGLRSGLNSNAANLLFQARKADDVTSDLLGAFQVNVTRYNEWNPVNIEFQASETQQPNFYLGVNSQYSFLSVDDYNVQNDYLGETFKPFVELDIDTSGIIDYQGRIV